MLPVVVLDVDDTLYLEETYVLSGIAHLDRWLAATHGIRGFGAAAAEAFLAGNRAKAFDAALARLGVAAEPALIDAMLLEYRGHDPKIDLAGDAQAFLQAAAGNKIFCVITDGNKEQQRRKVRALQLYKYCRKIIITDRWGRAYWKPNPRAYCYIEQSLGATADMCTYVGANPAKDFTTPRQRGWRTIRMRRDRGLHSGVADDPVAAADVTVTSFADLSGSAC